MTRGDLSRDREVLFKINKKGKLKTKKLLKFTRYIK